MPPQNPPLFRSSNDLLIVNGSELKLRLYNQCIHHGIKQQNFQVENFYQSKTTLEDIFEERKMI